MYDDIKLSLIKRYQFSVPRYIGLCPARPEERPMQVNSSGSHPDFAHEDEFLNSFYESGPGCDYENFKLEYAYTTFKQ